MTKEQILSELEYVKELTNDAGKRCIDGIRAGVMELFLEKAGPARTEETLDEIAVGHFVPKVVSKPLAKPEVKKGLFRGKK